MSSIDLNIIPQFIEEYDKHLEEAEDRLRLKGKNIETANKEQPTWLCFYDQKKAEVDYVLKRVLILENKIRGQVYRQYKENYSRELGEREINRYIDCDKEYLSIVELRLIIEELLDKYKALCSAFSQRGYSLKNITDIRVHQLEAAEL